MHVDSLDELKSAFEVWRSNKKHMREAIPEQLLDRARQATKRYGVTEVVGATGVQRDRLFRVRPAQQAAVEPQALANSVPTYSRLELSAPSAPSLRPIAEVETGSGVTLRVFDSTPEMMRLLSVICGIGGVR